MQHNTLHVLVSHNAVHLTWPFISSVTHELCWFFFFFILREERVTRRMKLAQLLVLCLLEIGCLHGAKISYIEYQSFFKYLTTECHNWPIRNKYSRELCNNLCNNLISCVIIKFITDLANTGHHANALKK